MFVSTRLASFVAIGILATLPATALEAASRNLDDLLVKYRCAVYDRLAQIHDTRPTPHDRYLIIALAKPAYAYVQCLFEDGDTTMVCEAASGFYYHVPRDVRLPKPAIAALAGLGYSTDDSKGNFQIGFALPNPPDLARIADFMLTSLNAAYGADGSADLTFEAPYAKHATGACAPTS